MRGREKSLEGAPRGIPGKGEGRSSKRGKEVKKNEKDGGEEGEPARFLWWFIASYFLIYDFVTFDFCMTLIFVLMFFVDRFCYLFFSCFMRS